MLCADVQLWDGLPVLRLLCHRQSIDDAEAKVAAHQESRSIVNPVIFLNTLRQDQYLPAREEVPLDRWSTSEDAARRAR